MTKHLRLLGLTLLAMFALGATTAASASAEESPVILPNTTGLTFKSTGVGNAVLKGVSEITCTAHTSFGEFTAARAGNLEVTFTGCTTNKGATKCKSLGDANGTILLSKKGTLFDLVDVLLGGVLFLGLIVLLDELVHIECAILSVLVLGAVIGEFTEITSLTKTTKAKLTFALTEGKQGEVTCMEPVATCNGKTFELKSEIGKGEKEATEEAVDNVTFNKEIEAHF